MKPLWKNNKPMPATSEALRQALAQQSENLSARVNSVCEAVYKTFRTEIYDEAIFWPQEVYDDHVIVRSIIDGKFYSIPYTIGADEAISFGEATAVELEYVPVDEGAGEGDDASEQACCDGGCCACCPACGGSCGDACPCCADGSCCVACQSCKTKMNLPQPDGTAEGFHKALKAALGQQSGDGEERQMISAVRVTQAVDQSGLVFRCQIIAFGMSLTRDIWERQIFEQSRPMWEGIACYRNHPSQTELVDRPERNLEDKMGWWSNVEVTDQGVDATLTLLPSFASFGRDLQYCLDQDNPSFLPFSIVARTMAKTVQAADGQPATMHTRIVRPLSVDAVTQAAADGRVKVALASLRGQANTQGESKMKKQWLRRLFRDNQKRFELVRQSLVAANAQGITAQSTVEQLVDAVCADEQIVAQCDMAIEMADTMIAQSAPAQQTTSQAAPPAPQVEGAPQTNPRARNIEDMLIAQAWQSSGVPEAIAAKRRTALGANATLEQHQADIEIAREICGEFTQSGEVRDALMPRAQVGAGEFEKRSIALFKAFGLSREEASAPNMQSFYEAHCAQSGTPVSDYGDQALWNSIQPVRSIQDFYKEVTGDVGLTGRAPLGQRITRQATWLTSDFTELLGNVVNKRLLKDYRAIDYGWRRVVTIKPVKDFKAQYAVLLGYLGDLSSVNQDGAYTEIAAPADTQESYTVAKRGNIVSLSLEDIANDDLGGFARTIGRMGRAAARTLAKFVWNTCIFANPTLAADSVALFHATHNNLINDALSTNGLKSAITKLLSQTEPGSSEALVLSTMNLTLAVPPGLALDAMALTDFNYQSPGETSSLSTEIRKMGITPVNVPILSDANDWAIFADPAEVDMVEVGFFNGQEEPEFFTQADPTQGTSFTQDVVARYKVRHIYSGAPVDFRGMVKSSVA